jgi:hypothetical protein
VYYRQDNRYLLTKPEESSALRIARRVRSARARVRISGLRPSASRKRCCGSTRLRNLTAEPTPGRRVRVEQGVADDLQHQTFEPVTTALRLRLRGQNTRPAAAHTHHIADHGANRYSVRSTTAAPAAFFCAEAMPFLGVLNCRLSGTVVQPRIPVASAPLRGRVENRPQR